MHGKFFAVIVEKAFLTGGEDPYERALEELLSRFDLYLSRMYRDHDQRNKGMVVIADSNYRTRLEVVARHFVAHGTRWRETPQHIGHTVFHTGQKIVAYYRSPIWSLIPSTDDTNLDTLDSLIGFCINLTRMTEGRSTVWSTFAETGFVATEPAVGHDLRSICLASLVLLPQLSPHPSGGALPVGSENIPTGQYGGGCPVAPFQLNHPPEASR